MFVDCELVPAPGQPKVYVGPGGSFTKPWNAHFIRCGMTPDDVVFADDPKNEGSVVLIDHEDGRKWVIRFQDGKKVVQER